MTIFKNKENAFDEVKKDLFKRIAIYSILILIVMTSRTFRGGGREDLIVLLVALPIVGIVLGLSFFIVIKRQKEIFESYTLTISDQEIIREQLNTPTISIPFASVKSIDKDSKGFFVRSNIKDIIRIPLSIDRIELLEKILSQVQPIGNTVKKTFIEKNSNLFAVLSLSLLMPVYVSNNKLLVGVCGVFVLLLLGYSFYETQTNKNIDNKTKNMSWIILLVLISIAAKIYAVLAV